MHQRPRGTGISVQRYLNKCIFKRFYDRIAGHICAFTYVLKLRTTNLKRAVLSQNSGQYKVPTGFVQEVLLHTFELIEALADHVYMKRV